jgi:hypothetical protein
VHALQQSTSKPQKQSCCERHGRTLFLWQCKSQPRFLLPVNPADAIEGDCVISVSMFNEVAQLGTKLAPAETAPAVINALPTAITELQQ